MLHQEMARLAKGLLGDPVDGAPAAEFVVSPETGEEAASVLRFASENKLKVLFWGAGTHHGMGYRFEPDVIVTTQRMNRIVEWQEEDLTIVVEPGVMVADLEMKLAERGQTAVLPEVPAGGTVGGAVAAGRSAWRRLRYGPTRDRTLEVRLVTGDGRLIRAGGRLVKNVTGYDIPRLATGSFGSLGLITDMCLKLWPLPPESATVVVDDPERALAVSYRPLALIETPDSAMLFVAGTAEEIDAQAQLVGGETIPGHKWPTPLDASVYVTVRVPPSAVPQWVMRLRTHGVAFQAAHGVGEIRVDAEAVGLDALQEFRAGAEASGGAVVVVRAPLGFDFDPWGTPPASAELQRRVKAAFDPLGIANPGILPGGI